MSDNYFDDVDLEGVYSSEEESDLFFEESEESHELEGFFGVEPNTTMVERAKHVSRKLIEHEEYDDKDNEIEADLEVIYQKAMEGFGDSINVRFSDDPKSEMMAKSQANEFLKTALQATKERANIKQNKDKGVIAKNKITNNNNSEKSTIVMDRNELLKMLRNTSDEDAVDGEFEEESNE